MHTRALAFAAVLATSPAVLATIPAGAQPVTDFSFRGAAHIGSGAREVGIRLVCALKSRRVDNLSFEMDLPDAEALQPGFDVSPFEGPDGIGARSRVTVEAASRRAEAAFSAAGWFGNGGGPASTFTFGKAFEPGDRALAQAQAVGSLLTRGTARLRWTVQNAQRGKPDLTASADPDRPACHRLQPHIHDRW